MSIDIHTDETAADVLTGIVPAPALAAALAAIIPHASTDATLPMLRAVRFETSADLATLNVVATNRYTIGVYRLPWNGDCGPVAASITLDDAKNLLSYAKKTPKTTPIGLTFNESDVEAFNFDRRVTYRHADDNFPSWDSLIPSADNDSGVERIAFNPAMLALFAKVAARNVPMIMTFGSGPTRAVRVDIGDSFTGVIMPVRIAS